MRIVTFAALQLLFAPSDEQAMWRVKSRDDPAAFAQLVRHWEKPIRNLCARMIGDVHRAEDLAQDVFARVFARRKQYQPEGKFSTWLWRIALNRCYDELRRTRRHNERSLESELGAETNLEVPLAPEPMPDDAAVMNESAALVREALLTLGESHRSVVVLRHYQDLKFREIADALGIPEGTAKSRMAEAMSQLARLLQPVFEEESKRIPPPLARPRHKESFIL